MHELLVFTPRSGTENDAFTAIFVLQAHAANNLVVSYGLLTAARCASRGRLLSGSSQDFAKGAFCAQPPLVVIAPNGLFQPKAVMVSNLPSSKSSHSNSVD
ncbi:hypothetical protein EBB79_19840 [Parasedimentitalea marina]|uniref:Uncharacterized protein n=1 Tax=Parasedimentitalea marina TaxID=2483033 RepID=A0A3T0N7G3_9RHOB|nr:hypothetical protein [Parasedimentitalea marina]AZV79911.1 hypothetical protein EBB79_19840 [Parasedimentitalea marina]